METNLYNSYKIPSFIPGSGCSGVSIGRQKWKEAPDLQMRLYD